MVSPIDFQTLRRARITLAFVVAQLLGRTKIPAAMAGSRSPPRYGLHPANADTVNYIIASEVTSTLGVDRLLRPCSPPAAAPVLSLRAPGRIAILAKPPAAIFALLFAVFRPFPDDKHKPRHGGGSGGVPCICDLRSDLVLRKR